MTQARALPAARALAINADTANPYRGKSMRMSHSEFDGSTVSQRLLRAAVSGLVAASSAAACDDDSSKSNAQELEVDELKALCADMVEEAKSENGSAERESPKPEEVNLDAVCKDKVEEAKKSIPKPNVEMLCADPVKTAVDGALKPKTAEEKTTGSEQKEYSFAALTKMCDERGGYAEIHAACGGQNTCKGFSYGDWGPDAAVLTEHSCTGTNGCLGLSCVVGVEGRFADKTGAELYGQEFSDTEPHDCLGCHAETLDENDHSKKDLNTFFVWVQPGSTRTAENWLDVPATEQERKVFFGARYTDGHGRQIQNMAAYHKVLSRKEIERVVAHIRTLKPIVRTMKVQDP
jgi:hypothetical protein